MSNNFCRTAVLKKIYEFSVHSLLNVWNQFKLLFFPSCLFYVCVLTRWGLLFCCLLFALDFTPLYSPTYESGFARTSWLTAHPLNPLWSASPLTGGSRDMSCGIHRTLYWGRRDDGESVGVIGAGVIGADQVDALQLFFFTYLEKSLPEEHWKANKSWILSCREVSKLVFIKHSHIQLEASWSVGSSSCL